MGVSWRRQGEEDVEERQEGREEEKGGGRGGTRAPKPLDPTENQVRGERKEREKRDNNGNERTEGGVEGQAPSERKAKGEHHRTTKTDAEARLFGPVSNSPACVTNALHERDTSPCNGWGERCINQKISP